MGASGGIWRTGVIKCSLSSDNCCQALTCWGQLNWFVTSLWDLATSKQQVTDTFHDTFINLQLPWFALVCSIVCDEGRALLRVGVRLRLHDAEDAVSRSPQVAAPQDLPAAYCYSRKTHPRIHLCLAGLKPHQAPRATVRSPTARLSQLGSTSATPKASQLMRTLS